MARASRGQGGDQCLVPPDDESVAYELSFEVGDLLPLVDAACPLEVEGAQAFLTETGRDWYTAGILASKETFASTLNPGAAYNRTATRSGTSTESRAIVVRIAGRMSHAIRN